MKRWFFVWIIPLLWAACSLVHFRFPGDEYGMYFVSSIAGSWIDFFFHFGDIHDPIIPLSIALAGSAVMAPFGFLMDRVRISKRLWATLFCVCALGLFFDSVGSYPSIAKALAKNGSWWAYILFSFNIGLYCSIVLALLLTAVWRGLGWLRQKRTIK